jgi:hypothetical protein
VFDTTDTCADERLDLPTVVDFVRIRTDPAVLLELGVGTGGLAIPLARAGVRTYGVDSSAELLARLREQDPGGLVTLFEGSMTEPSITAPFGCVLIARDAFATVPDHTTWAKCFGAAAQRLSADGRLIIEGPLPDPTSWGSPTRVPRPEELDLLASNVALRLTERYEDFSQRPFTPCSPKCVSVYQRVL